MTKKKVEMKGNMEIKELVGHLKAMAKSLESGEIVVENNGESVTLTPSGPVKFEAKAKQKEGKEKYSFEMSWKITRQEEEKTEESQDEE